jgi:hypothetical protein
MMKTRTAPFLAMPVLQTSYIVGIRWPVRRVLVSRVDWFRRPQLRS